MENGITIDIETQARLVNGHWAQLKKTNKWRFQSAEAESQCKTLFILGYHSAWRDMCEISGKARELDELLAKQE